MIEIKQYACEYRSVWDEFVEHSKNGTFMLKRDYMDYHSDRFIDNSLMFYKDKKLIALLPANINQSVLYSHQGLTYGGIILGERNKTLDSIFLFETLLSYLKSKEIHKFIYKRIPHIYHQYPSEEDLYCLFKYGGHLCRRDISTTIKLSNKLRFSKSKKNGVAQANRSNVVVCENYDYSYFFEMEKKVLKRHKAKPVHTAEEMKVLASKFPNNIRLFCSKYKGDIISGVLVYSTEKCAHLQYIANSEMGKKIGGLDIIIQHLVEKEYRNKDYFDFGISTESNGYILNEGLIAQKEMFGGRAICYDQYELEIK